MEATLGPPASPSLITLASSELTLSGDQLRPWPVELRLAPLPLTEWGLPLAPPPPLLDHTLYSEEVHLTGNLITTTEFDTLTHVSITIRSHPGPWINLAILVPKFVPKYDLTTLIYSGAEPEPGTFRLPPLKRVTIESKLPAWASGAPIEGEGRKIWKVGNPTSSWIPNGGPLRLFLAVGDVNDALQGKISYNPINPAAELDDDYANSPTGITTYVCSQLRPFEATLRGITEVKMHGLSGEVPGIGKSFTEDSHIKATLSGGTLEVRGISPSEEEYYDNKSHTLKLQGNATGFEIDGTNFIDLESSQYDAWPSWRQLLVSACLSAVPWLLPTLWRKRRSKPIS